MSRRSGGSTAWDNLERRVSELESGGGGGGSGGGGTEIVNSSLKSTNAGTIGNGVVALGRDSQATGINGVAVGADTRANAQYAVSLGVHAGVNRRPNSWDLNESGENSISIGFESSGIGTSSIALGYRSEATYNNSICINATGTFVDTPNVGSSLVVKPVRSVPRGLGANAMHYDSSTGEITYSTPYAGGIDGSWRWIHTATKGSGGYSDNLYASGGFPNFNVLERVSLSNLGVAANKGADIQIRFVVYGLGNNEEDGPQRYYERIYKGFNLEEVFDHNYGSSFPAAYNQVSSFTPMYKTSESGSWITFPGVGGGKHKTSSRWSFVNGNAWTGTESFQVNKQTDGDVWSGATGSVGLEQYTINVYAKAA